ncbi:hypothetical protein BsWGS_27801 [Bradybaena similaris]
MPGAKKAQRTKGNVKPSSSSQAALLLAASGQAPTGFIGFSSQPAFVPASETFDDAESAVDDDFRLVLRKLSKRDSVTKIKALQEFITLCCSKDEAAIKTVVPFWPRMYSKIAIDVDHKVRELSHKALASLASRAGKTLAPHLRSMMGLWMVGMCDTYPTVASASNTAFTSTFSAAKQTEAVRFCKTEIAECLMNYILQQTSRTLSDPLTTSEEDMESKYQRVVSSSLQAFSKLLHMLQAEGLDDSVTATLSKLLDSPVFWKHAKSTLPQIKCGVLSVLSATCQLCPEASRKVITKLSPFIFSCLDSTDSSVISQTWEAVLSMISAHEECWQHVNWQKAVWPKIKQVLETGCAGQATVVCPCLLPLLSKIPKINFTHFFDAFRLGLREESVLNSPLELSALVRSFVECIQYSVRWCAENEDNPSSEIRSLIVDQVLLVVQASLTDSKPGLTKTDLFPRLCTLLSVVAKVDSGIEDEFWLELSSFIRGLLLAEFVLTEKNIPEPLEKKGKEPIVFQRLKLLIEGLVYQQTFTSAKMERVRFTTEESQAVYRTNFSRQKQSISDATENFISDVFVTVFRLAFIKEHTAPLFFGLFKDLCATHIPDKAAERLTNNNDRIAGLVVSELGTNEVIDFNNFVGDDFMKFIQSTTTGNIKENKFSAFVCDHLVKILLCAQREENMKMPLKGQFTDDVVVSLFAFTAHIDEEDGASILFEVLHNLTEPQITCQFIEHLLGHAKLVPGCKPLVAGTDLAGKIEHLTVAVTGQEKSSKDAEETVNVSNAVWKMLTSVVSSFDESDNHLFSQSCLDAVVTSCLATLQQLQVTDVNQRVDTASSVVDLVLSLLDKHKISMHAKLGELVLSLLRLLLTAAVQPGEESSSDVLSKLKSAWLAGLKIILLKKSDVEIQQFVQQLCAVVKQFIQETVNSNERLLSVVQILGASLRTIASPAAGTETDDDDHSESNDQQQATEEDSVDVETLTVALDELLMLESMEVVCLKEVLEYLFIDGSLDSLPPKPSPSEVLSIQAYLVRLLHNLHVLQLSMELLHGQGQSLEVQHKSHQWTTTQIQAMVQLCYGLLVLETAKNMKLEDLKGFPSTVLIDIQAGLLKCVRSLNVEQLSSLVDLVTQRTYPAYTLGVKRILELASQSQPDEEKVSSVFASALLSIRENFLSRCLQSDSSVREISQLLGGPKISGHEVCEAFTLASTVILSCEEFSVGCLAGCLSGFVRLAEDCSVLDEEAKVSLFHQLVLIMKQLKDRNIHLLSESAGTAEVSFEHYHLNVSIVRALTALMIPGSDHYWEVTLCALVDWIQFLSRVKQIQTSDAEVKALLISTCDLAFLATKTFDSSPIAADPVPRSPSLVVTEKARTEWNEFFSDGVFSPMLPMFVSVASSEPTQNEPLWTLVVKSLASVVSLCPGRLVLTHQLPARLTTTDKSCLPDNLKTLFNHLCPLLMSNQRCVEVAAYKLLNSVIGEIPKHDTCADDEDKQEEELRSPPEALIDHVEAAGHFLECLKVVQVEDHIEMDPGTSEHAQAMGYLLAWCLLLQLFRCSPNQLRAKYAQYFKTKDSVSHLLDRLFRLMPQQPSPSMLEFNPQLYVHEGESDEELCALAMYVYRQCLEILPALVRTWWVDQDRKSSNFVDRFTTQYLSSALMWQQITSAQSTNNIDGITIRARPAAREVSATYEMAEVTVNMSITLPENYPLGKLEVACDKRVGVSQAQWDRWLLQLNIFLQHQNGSIVDGLRLWKGNIDKKFEGVEDCMVCFSVIHGTTFQLPRLTCKTCRKKFHSACLYKWFNTAQKSSCPLCRNLF